MKPALLLLALVVLSTAASGGPIIRGSPAKANLPEGGVELGDSALEQLISSMDVGEWEELTGMGGDWNDGGIFNSGINGYDAEFGSDLVWDPNHRTFWHIGAGHIQEPTAFNYTHFVKWDIDSNNWTLLCDTDGEAGVGDCPPNAVPSGWGHTYSHLALNTNNQRLYARVYGTQIVMVWNTDTEEWESNVEFAPSATPDQCCGGFDYFPERDSLIFVDGDWGVWEGVFSGPSDTTPTNTKIAHTNDGSVGLTDCNMIPQPVAAEYHPDAGIVLIGGYGMCRVNSDGSVTLLNDEEAGTGESELTIGSHAGSGVTGSKVVARSGTNLFDVYADLGSNTESQWTYDPTTDTWDEVDPITAEVLINGGIDGPVHGLIGTNVPEMCAQVFVQRLSNGGPNYGRVMVYKYAESC